MCTLPRPLDWPVAILLSATRRFGLRAGTLSLLLVAPGLAPAQSGTWSQNIGGTYNWSGATNWQLGVVANGADNTATFATFGLTAPITVTLDTSRTIGSLVFDNPSNTFGWTLRSG